MSRGRSNIIKVDKITIVYSTRQLVNTKLSASRHTFRTHSVRLDVTDMNIWKINGWWGKDLRTPQNDKLKGGDRFEIFKKDKGGTDLCI